MFTLLRHRLTRRILATLVFELIALNLCLGAVLQWRGIRWDTSLWTGELAFLVPTFVLTATLVIQLALWSFGLYSREVIYSGRQVILNLGAAFVMSMVLLLPVCYGFKSISNNDIFVVTEKFYLAVLAAFISVVAIERALVLKLCDGSSYLGKVLILGADGYTPQVIREARIHHGASVHLVGILANAEDVGQRVAGVEVVGTLEELNDTVRRLEINTILVSLSHHHRRFPLDELVELKLAGIEVLDAGAFYEGVSHKVLIEKLDPTSVLRPEAYRMSRLRWFFKDVNEKFLALVGLMLAAIPLAAIMLLVRLTSPGRVIYTQQRVGRKGKVFTLYKFRTMVEHAEANGPEWSGGDRDHRTTSVGRWLRRLRLDELPQLYNILKGDMAFVGPRPERPEFVSDLKKMIPYYHYRHFVKPGLTGWAQVMCPYASSVDASREKLRYDLYYIKNMSLFFDLLVLLATVRAVARGPEWKARQGAARSSTSKLAGSLHVPSPDQRGSTPPSK